MNKLQKLKLAFKYYIGKLKIKKININNPTFNLGADMKKDGSAKGGDIWGSDWPIPVAEELEWSFYQTVQYQYIRTKLTDYILWLFPFSYDEYILQVPKDTYDIKTIDNRQVVDAIADCHNWSSKGMDNITDQYNGVMVWYRNSKWWYELGNNDYDFMVKH